MTDMKSVQSGIPDVGHHSHDGNDTAILSSFDHYTTFSFGGRTLTFRTCDGLEKYTTVLTWDNGYLEVLAKYR